MSNSGPIETRVKVLTWNIWWQFGPWQDRATAILAALQAADPDIICLQEVWNDASGGFTAQLARDLGYHHYYAECMELGNIGFGNAILSRWPIETSATTQLYGFEQTMETRIALYALIDGPRGKLPVFTTHTNWRYEESHIRQHQVADVARFVAAQPSQKSPPILSGDFNAEPDSDEMRALVGLKTCPVPNLVFHDAWTMAGSGPGYTWDNQNGHASDVYEANRRIDYILTGRPKGRGRGHVTNCRLIGDAKVDDIWPSDHFGVMAEIRY